MSTIYLLRHGRPELPRDKKMCVGVTDVPLSGEGYFQAALLGLFLEDAGVDKAYSSDLARSVETARGAGLEPVIFPALREMDMGEWDGLSFDEIKEKYPELYLKRGEEPEKYVPDGGEAPSHAASRLKDALSAVAQGGDAAAVCHAGAMRFFLAELLDISGRAAFELPIPYGSVTELKFDGGRFSVQYIGKAPTVRLDGRHCRRLHALMRLSEDISRHCEAVRDNALIIADRLAENGVILDRDALCAAALLHDIARSMPAHAEVGAEWLKNAGYRDIARIVAEHHDISRESIEDCGAGAALYIADKLTLGDETVTLETRFARSGKKCTTPEAEAAHKRRFADGKEILRRITEICGDTPF